jgi:antitoxin MazE
MVTRVQKWGNSQGLRLSKAVLQEAHIVVGDAVKVSVEGRTIIIEPVEQVRGRYDLKELVSKLPPDYHVEEIAWGEPVGKEVW